MTRSPRSVIPERRTSTSHDDRADSDPRSKRAFRPRQPDIDEWESLASPLPCSSHTRESELQFYLGRAREQQGEEDAAKLAYEAAVRLDEKFVPALAALADIGAEDRPSGRGADDDRALHEASPVAAMCVETRADILIDTGECKRARDEATQWGTLEPQSPRPFATLARALHADGAPRPSVDEVLARCWSLAPTDQRKSNRDMGQGASRRRRR